MDNITNSVAAGTAPDFTGHGPTYNRPGNVGAYKGFRVSVTNGGKLHRGVVRVYEDDGAVTVSSACTPTNGARNPRGVKPFQAVDAAPTCRKCAARVSA